MAISQQQRTELLTLLVGMFDAAPGSDIFDELANGIDNGNTIAQYAANLVESSEFTGIYSRGLTAEEFATSFIANLLGDNVTAETTAEAEAFVAGRLNAGASRDTVIIEALTALSAVSEDDATWGAAVAQLNNKVEVAQYFALNGGFSGLSLAQMQAVLNGVTSDDATVTAATTAIDSGNLDGVGSTGQTFTLTTGQDNVVGTAGNDTVIALVDGTDNTLTLGDVINGGAGTDTLRVTTDQAAIDLAVATISNVENFDLNMDAAGEQAATTVALNDTAFATATVEGVSGVQGGADTLAVSGVLASTKVVLEDITDVATTVTFSDVTGTSDSATIEVAGSAEDTDDGENDLTVAGIETLNLNFTTDDNLLATITAAAAETVNITVDADADTTISEAAALTAAEAVNIVAEGDLTLAATADLADEAAITVSGAGDVNLATLDASAGDGNTLDASALTGDLTVTGSAGTASITAGAGADDITSGVNTTDIVAGAGNDIVRLAALDYSATTAGSVAGGEGRDTLSMTDATNLDTDYLANVTGFEVLDGVGSTTQDYDVDGLGFEELTLSGAVTTSVTFSNITDEALTITGNTGAEVIYSVKDATGDSDSLTITIEGAAVDTNSNDDTSDDTNDISAGSITNTQAVETINLVSNTAETNEAGVDNDITMLDTNASTVNVSGNHVLTITEFEDGGAVNATIDTIDASASAGLIMGDYVSTLGVSITGSDSADTLLVGDDDGTGTGTATGSTVNAGKGGDVVTISVAGAADTLIIDAGDSLIGYVDTDESEAFETANDEELYDIVTGFTTGEDTIDLGSFGFSGQKASALAGPSLTEAEAVDLVDGTTSEIANFFVDTGVQRGVATVSGDFSDLGGTGTDTLVFIDSDGNGSLTSADDMVLLSGTATVALADFGF